MRISKWFLISFVVLSFIGLCDSVFLTISHYLNQTPLCVLFEGCDIVLKSKYSEFVGMPVAIFGAIYYFVVLALSMIFISLEKEKIIKITAKFTIVGFVVSLWFLYVQAFLLHAFCIYCVISAIDSTLLFIWGMIMLRLYKLRICAN